MTFFRRVFGSPPYVYTSSSHQYNFFYTLQIMGGIKESQRVGDRCQGPYY